MKHLINFTCYKKQITYFRTVIYSPFLYPKTERKISLKYRSIDDVVKNVLNNIHAVPSDIKEAIDFLSIAKETKAYTKTDINSMKLTLDYRLSVIYHI